MTRGPDALVRSRSRRAFFRRTILLLCLPASAAGESREAAARLIEKGENAAALRTLESLSDDEFLPRERRLALARVHFLKGDLPAAKALLKETDDDPLPLLTRAQILSEEGKTAEALSLYDRLLAVAPWRPLVFFLKGELLEATGRGAEAEDAHRAALAEDASFTESRPRLARLAESRGDGEAAWRQWDRVAAVDAKNAEARDALTRLTPTLARPPEDIRPVRRLPSHRGAPCPAETWGPPFLRVGIATDGKGAPQPLKKAVFRASASFRISSLDGSIPPLAGQSGERWTVKAGEKGEAVLLFPDGREAARSARGFVVRPDQPARDTLIVDGLTYAPGFVWSGASDKELRGELEISARGSGLLTLVAVMPVEAYLYGVVGAEMPSTWPDEALKTQAVVARTYAAARRAARPHRSHGYDLCDEQHCQVYSGAAAEAASVRSAVDGTRRLVLFHKGRPAGTFYASNCGGHGRAAGEVWGGGTSYLGGVPEGESFPRNPWDFRRWITSSPPVPCGPSRFVPAAHHRWARVLDAATVEAAARKRKDIGALRRVEAVERGSAGHVLSLRVMGERENLLLSGDGNARRFLGDGPLRSALYTMEMEERGGKPRRFYVFGGGWGHGVGLCQAGAAGRAEAGENHGDILTHYFPGAALSGEGIPSPGNH